MTSHAALSNGDTKSLSVTGAYDRSDLRPSRAGLGQRQGRHRAARPERPFFESGQVRPTRRDLPRPERVRRVACGVAALRRRARLLWGRSRSALRRWWRAGCGGGPLSSRSATSFPTDSNKWASSPNSWRSRGCAGGEAVCCRGAHSVVALSDTMAERLRERHRLDRVAVVPNSANLELFGGEYPRPTAMSAGAAHFVYTGTLGRANDCGQILRAARYLKAWSRSDIHIHLIGDGSERRALGSRSREGRPRSRPSSCRRCRRKRSPTGWPRPRR